jgi:predicted small lipoprotein YifL
MPRLLRILAAASLAALLLAGCGTKGQLVLPDQQPKKHKNSPPAPAKAPESNPAGPAQTQDDAKDAGH